jgi:hypothetical protein
MRLYHCPDCDRIHDDPYEAAFSLLAPCVDCGADADYRRALAAPAEILQAA